MLHNVEASLDKVGWLECANKEQNPIIPYGLTSHWVWQVDKANLAELDLDRDGVISRDELMLAMRVRRNNDGTRTGMLTFNMLLR